jgi:hypothetical protein
MGRDKRVTGKGKIFFKKKNKEKRFRHLNHKPNSIHQEYLLTTPG